VKRTFLATVVYLCLSSLALAGANPDGVAVIIGNQKYMGDIPTVDFAHRDAEAVKHFVINVLGFDEENIIDLRDASKAKIEAAFGNSRSHKGRVWRYAHPSGRSDIFVYYSGHGVPGQSNGKGYLLPSDSSPDDVEINGFPLTTLFRNLSKIKARTKTVLLDVGFSGLNPKGSLIKSASPIFISSEKIKLGAGMVVLTAAGSAQIANWDEKSRHGLFTEYLLRGVYGEADSDGNGQVNIAEIKSFMDREMSKDARKRFGREQNASLTGKRSAVLATYSPGARPARPIIPDVMTKPKVVAVAKTQPGSQSIGPSRMKVAPVSRFDGGWEWETSSDSDDCNFRMEFPAKVTNGKFTSEVSHTLGSGIQILKGIFDETGKITGSSSGDGVSVQMEGQAEEIRAVGILRVRGKVNCIETWVAERVYK